MAVTLISTSVPAPQAYSGLKTLASAAVDSAPGLYSASPIESGDTTELPSVMNRNAMQLDLMGRYAGGWYGIAHGLVLEDGGGLLGTVTAGHAMIDGIQEFAETDVVLYANTVNHVWAKRDRTFEVKNNVLTVPSIPSTYLGAYTTNGSAITSIDESGRCTLRNGLMYRETGDLGMPADTPNSVMSFMAVTAGGRWLWDGDAWLMQTNAVPLAQDSVLEAQSLVVPEGHRQRVFGSFDVLGSLAVSGIFEVSA